MTAPAMEGAHWLSVAETAETLNVKPRRIYELIERCALPHLRIGRIVRLNLAAVVEALKVDPVPTRTRTSDGPRGHHTPRATATATTTTTTQELQRDGDYRSPETAAT